MVWRKGMFYLVFVKVIVKLIGREGVFILFVSPKFPICVLWGRGIEKGQELL